MRESSQKYEIGDRVVFTEDGCAWVCWIRSDGAIGLEFDNQVGYAHNCGGHGKGGGYNAWVRDYEVEHIDNPGDYELPLIDELF